MAYGEEKTRGMSRSLLPSTGRKGARTVRIHIHRSARRTARLEGGAEATLKLLGWKPEDGPRPPPGHHGTWEARSSSTRRRAP